MITFAELKEAKIAHTDAGDFFVINDETLKEVEVKATIKKKRAGLLFLDIEGETFSVHSRGGFNIDEEVIALIRHHNGHYVHGIEKLS